MNPLDVGATILGQPLTAISVHRAHRSTIVVRARTADAREVVVKSHTDRERHDREVHAYRSWVPALAGNAPALLGVDDKAQTICITAVPGIALADANLSVDEQHHVHTQAGRLLAAYHHASPARIDDTYRHWLANRARHWISRAGDLVDDAYRAAATADAAAIGRLPLRTLAPCHLDFTPGNILTATAGHVSVIDFEHSRYDHPARDLVRLAIRVWPERPDLEHAFIGGYGPLDDLDRELIRRYAAIDHISALVTHARREPAGSLRSTESSLHTPIRDYP